MFQAMRNKFHWSTSHSCDEKRRHTFRDRTQTTLNGRNSLQEKRCVSMPSVTLLTSSDVRSSSHRSRLLRLQDRRFHSRFAKVPPDERLVNYFSCALVSDILLQGHLFITKNYFAFYSNIFGHKTEILISVADVVKVTKEKTAKIIPNAVGVYTETDKFVFGSMLSRDSAYRVVQQTWIQSTDAGVGLPDDSESEHSPAIMIMADEDSSVSSGVSGHLLSDDISLAAASDVTTVATTPDVVSLLEDRLSPLLSKPPTPSSQSGKQYHTYSCRFDFVKGYVLKIDEIIASLAQLPRTSLLFMMSTVLLIILFVSTSVLLYRIHLVHQRLTDREDFYEGSAARFVQTTEFGSDVTKLVSSLEERIRSLGQIRQTLEELLLVANKFQKVPRMSLKASVT